MNISELRRRRNEAVKKRDASYANAHRAYKNRRAAKAAHAHNAAMHARKRVNDRLTRLRTKAKALGINVTARTAFGGRRNKTAKELESNITRRVGSPAR